MVLDLINDIGGKKEGRDKSGEIKVDGAQWIVWSSK
jgi:hypothetical protein